MEGDDEPIDYEYLIDENCKKFIVDPKDFVKEKGKKDVHTGGFGVVSFVIQKSTNIKCVSKKTSEPLTNEEFNRSFYREISTLVKCVHPAIVSFVGFATIKNFGFVYLKTAANGSLSSILEDARKGKGTIRLNDTNRFIISYGIAKSMQFLHNNEYIHRDLKPANILIDENIYPLLTDFGTSKKLENVVQVNQTVTCSTATIMAPEFIKEPENYARTKPIDVYSYGMTIFELWTGVAPFSHIKSPFQLMNAVSEGQRPGIPASTPENWKELITKCWDQNPEERPTFDDIIDNLDSKNYYTDDMDIAAIEKYKKLIAVAPTKSEAKLTTSTKGEEKKEKTSAAKIEENEEPEPESEPEPEPEPEEPEDTGVENPLLTKMREEAQKGDIESQFNFAIAQFEGTYGKPNYDEAKEFARRYCQRKDAFEGKNTQNSSMMQYIEAKCYAQEGKYELAATKLKLSVQKGCADASFFLAELMFEGKVKYRPTEINNYYKIAADKGIPEAIKKYAFMLLYGTLGNPNKKLAIHYFKIGSDQGDPELMYMWATRLEYGRGVEKNTEEAMNLIKLSADKEYTPAMIDYGIHLLNGINIAKNENQAKLLFQAAAAKDDPLGQLWYYLMYKDNELTETVRDDNIDDLLTNSLNSNLVPEAWATYGRLLYESGSIEDSLPPLYFACASGSIDAFTCLGEMCEKNPSQGDANYYYEFAANYCHCLDTCGFTTPIKYKVYHCIDCDVDICEGCAKHCHADHSVDFTEYQSCFKCGCGKDGFKNKCSAEFIGKTKARQHMYHCATCCIVDETRFICKKCAEICHKGHQVIDCGVMQEYCSCGMHELPYNFNCHILNFNSFKECSVKKTKQRWFQCIQCGLYGSNDVGVCAKCAEICHDSHNLLDLGVRDECCCCKNAACIFQNE